MLPGCWKPSTTFQLSAPHLRLYAAHTATQSPLTLNKQSLKFPRVFGQTLPAAASQTFSLFGQSAPQTKTKRDTYQ